MFTCLQYFEKEDVLKKNRIHLKNIHILIAIVNDFSLEVVTSKYLLFKWWNQIVLSIARINFRKLLKPFFTYSCLSFLFLLELLFNLDQMVGKIMSTEHSNAIQSIQYTLVVPEWNIYILGIEESWTKSIWYEKQN